MKFCPSFDVGYFPETVDPRVKDMVIRSIVDRFNTLIEKRGRARRVHMVTEGPADSELFVGYGGYFVEACEPLNPPRYMPPLKPACIDRLADCPEGQTF